MAYSAASLAELVPLLVEKALKSSEAYEEGDDAKGSRLDDETRAVALEIIGRGSAGANALRPLLNDTRESIQLLAAVWLVKVEPNAAAPTLYRLESEAKDPEIGGFARLALIQAQDGGLLPVGR